MALRQIKFNCKGGPVTVEVAFGYLQVGAYSIVIWDKSGKSKQKIGEGVNTDQMADVYTLPQPTSKNDGDILDCMATILGEGPETEANERYQIDLIVRQDGVECGRQSEEGEIGARSVSTRLAARLVCRT